jgi:hypothetical protein
MPQLQNEINKKVSMTNMVNKIFKEAARLVFIDKEELSTIQVQLAFS